VARVLLSIGARQCHMTSSTTRGQIRWTNLRSSGQVASIIVALGEREHLWFVEVDLGGCAKDA
jgi:hypothetical protein